MKSIVFLILCLSLFLTLRSLSFAMTYMNIYGYREKECIERICKRQMAVDLINATYHSFALLVNLLFAVNSSLYLLGIEYLQHSEIVSFIIITIAYVAFFILRYKLEIKYELHNFYADMLLYRSKQKVVTEDNDHEVSFIRGYEKTLKYKTYMNLWYVVSLILFMY